MSPNRAHPLRPDEPALGGITVIITIIVILNARLGLEPSITCALLLAATAAHRRLA
ncbi:hypothetical protein ACFXPT_30685 [Streptomyces goshikiensis]|uniref:hypothetical protein n=1 Tax=Streptomyces goshikiensis TaxID=1942 RepID=UPI00367C1E2D